MILQVNDTEIQIPHTIGDITIGQRIDFHALYGRDLAARAKEISQMEDGEEQEIALAEQAMNRIFSTFAFFTNCTVQAVKESNFVDQVAAVYFGLLAGLMEDPEPVERRLFIWNSEAWYLPDPELKHGDTMTFGEFIDAKQLMKDHIESGSDGLEYLPKICAVFLRKEGEPYQESFLYEQSDRLQLMHSLPMDIAAAVARWFEQFNTFVHESFPVFFPSRLKSNNKFSKEHFNRFGWINFLKTIAQTKVFDLPGINSIEAARVSRLFDVLIWSSEEKSMSEAYALDLEAAKQKAK